MGDAAMLEVGKKAPAIRLKDAKGTTRTLAEHLGSWVVVYFYPKDDTPGCTTEACEFTGALPGFASLDAVVLGISPDTPESHAKFASKFRLGVTLLSDPDRATMKAYGAWGEKTLYGRKVVGVIRSTVIVDPEGRVAHRWKAVRSKGHAEAVRAKVQELASQRASAGKSASSAKAKASKP